MHIYAHTQARIAQSEKTTATIKAAACESGNNKQKIYNDLIVAVFACCAAAIPESMCNAYNNNSEICEESGVSLMSDMRNWAAIWCDNFRCQRYGYNIVMECGWRQIYNIDTNEQQKNLCHKNVQKKNHENSISRCRSEYAQRKKTDFLLLYES